ncbi:MAG: hypothetical protein KIT84_00335 [Labilithrix sp.]|nr:hypothetical protein [Labilithrix sp.]MCW5809430.1 hypothetical protein [Labilithrix sp.]
MVAAVAALVGCGALSNTAESPAFSGRASGKAAVLTVECDRGAPASSAASASVSGDKMKALLESRRIDVVAPSDPALVCTTYGRGAGGIDGFDVPASVASMIRETAKASRAETVLVNVATYERHCSDSEPKCDKRIVGATVRDFLFSADGVMLWKKWDFAPESADGAERAFATMFADVPVDKLVTASAAPAVNGDAKPAAAPLVAAALPSPEPAPAPETPATLLAQVSSSADSTCVGYAKLTCDRTTLDACRDAVAFVNTRPSAAKCKVLAKRVKARKVATR